jgi:Domain of unknown function (DUF1330)
VRNVVVEFDSFDEARSYYFSELYQTAKTKRAGAAIAEFVLVEGVWLRFAARRGIDLCLWLSAKPGSHDVGAESLSNAFD